VVEALLVALLVVAVAVALWRALRARRPGRVVLGEPAVGAAPPKPPRPTPRPPGPGGSGTRDPRRPRPQLGSGAAQLPVPVPKRPPTRAIGRRLSGDR
jgi:hypothetical protein